MPYRLGDRELEYPLKTIAWIPDLGQSLDSLLPLVLPYYWAIASGMCDYSSLCLGLLLFGVPFWIFLGTSLSRPLSAIPLRTSIRHNSTR